jgi:DNA-binding MarR family transcriptional regulator
MTNLWPDNWRNTECVCTSVRRADRALNRFYDDALRPSGLLTTQYALLKFIARAPDEFTLRRLAEAQVMDRTTLSRNLDPLLREGYVEIVQGRDKRTRIVSITAGGREAIERATPLWEAAQARIAAEYGRGKVERLLNELAELTSGIVAQTSKGTDRDDLA